MEKNCSTAPSRGNIFAIATLMGLLLAGCAENGSPQVRAPGDWGYDLTGIEVRRIGNDKVFFRENQNRAMHNALVELAHYGVPRSAVEAITIDTQGGEASGDFLSAGVTGVQFDLWVRLETCPKNIYFNAGASGRINTFYDKGNCLAG